MDWFLWMFKKHRDAVKSKENCAKEIAKLYDQNRFEFGSIMDTRDKLRDCQGKLHAAQGRFNEDVSKLQQDLLRVTLENVDLAKKLWDTTKQLHAVRGEQESDDK